MRFGLWCAPLVAVCVLVGCGIPKPRYYKQLARANRLESLLKKTMDRIDDLEAREKVARKKAQSGRAEDIAKMARVTREVARINSAMHKKEKALSACRETRVATPDVPYVGASLRKSRCQSEGVKVQLEEGLFVRGAGAKTARAKTALRAALGKVLPRIARCYLKASTRRKQVLRGNLVATLRMDKRGRARRVKIRHRALALPRVVKCTRRALSRLRTTAPAGPFFAAVPLRFGPRLFVVMRSCANPHKPGLSPKIVNRVIRRRSREIQYCLIQFGHRPRKLKKLRLQVTFVITKPGAVSKVKVAATGLVHAGITGCVKKRVMRWRFPKLDGDEVWVRRKFRWQTNRKKQRHRRRRRRKR